MSTVGSWSKGTVPSRGTPLLLSSRDGFTLVELALVIFIIALFSLLTVPIFAGWGEGSLQSSARRMAGTVKYLYNESALRKQEFRLTFDLDKGSYRAGIREADGELTDFEGVGRFTRLKDGVRFQDVAVAGQGKFSSGEVTAIIHPVGWLEETVVHLKDEKGRSLTLRLMPFTGATEIYEGYKEFDKGL